MIKNKKEYKYVRNIYALLIAMICIPHFIEGIGLLYSNLVGGLKFLCLLLIIRNEYKLYRMHSLKLPSGNAYKAIILLYIISFFIIIRGDWEISLKGLGLFVADGYVLPYLLPILILPLPNIKYIDLITSLFYKGAILAIPLWILFADKLVQEGTFRGESIAAYLPVFSAFLIGFPSTLNKRQKIYLLVICGVYFILMMLNARRNMIFSMGYCVMLAYYIHFLGRYASYKKKVFAIALLGIILYLGWNKSEKLFNKHFSNLSERIDVDSRSGVESYFIADFIKSPIEDWIFGRGMHGGYYQEEIYDENGKLMTNRQIIETGYLNMLLKGGLIYLILIVYILLLSLFNSIKIKNKYTAYLRWLFLLYFIDLYATVLMGIFCVKAIIFWFAISIALSKENTYKSTMNILS